MNRDAEELPLIIGDLEDGVKLIQANLYATRYPTQLYG